MQQGANRLGAELVTERVTEDPPRERATLLPPPRSAVARAIDHMRTELTVKRRVSGVHRVPVDAVPASLPTIRPARKGGR